MDAQHQNMELVNVAIQKIIEERKNNKTSDEDEKLLLSRLLSQLESLKEESKNEQPEASNKQDQDGDIEIDKEEIVKELKKVKKQNSITHWLLSIMIVLTVTWQISEVSMFLKLKDGFSHPFKHLGGMFGGMFKGRITNGQNHNNGEAPSLTMPELPRVEFPDFNSDGEKHETKKLES
ncbi:hypothetical protein UlMin_040031 [Ulmus minor]